MKTMVKTMLKSMTVMKLKVAMLVRCKVVNQILMMHKSNGVYSTRGEMYITTRTRKDGSIVDDVASHIVCGYHDKIWSYVYMVDDGKVNIMRCIGSKFYGKEIFIQKIV